MELSSAHFANSFRFLAGELRALRAAQGIDVSSEYSSILFRLNGLVADADEKGMLPTSFSIWLQEKNREHREGGGNLSELCVGGFDSLVGYYPQDAIVIWEEPGESISDEHYQPPEKTFVLRPGPITDLAPGVFQEIAGTATGSESVIDAAYELYKQSTYKIRGYEAVACEKLAEWVESHVKQNGEFDHVAGASVACKDCEPGAIKWLPDSLHPSPAQLNDLRAKLNHLADTIGKYERLLVSKPIKSITSNTIEKHVFVDLLRCLRDVALWDAGDDQFGEGDGPLFILWAGWLDGWAWSDWVRDVFQEVIQNLNTSGIPVTPWGSSIGLEFDDVCFNEPVIGRAGARLSSNGEPPECIAKISEGAVFLTLHPIDSPIISRSIRDGHYQSLQNYLHYYADEVANTLDGLQNRYVGDGRSMKIDLSRVSQFALRDDPVPKEGYYPQELLAADPFVAAQELEGLTGVKLANDEDPIWLLAQHRQFKQAVASFGEQSTFAEYMHRRFAERLFDPDDPLGEKRAYAKQQNDFWFVGEMEGLQDETLGNESDKNHSTVARGDVRQVAQGVDAASAVPRRKGRLRKDESNLLRTRLLAHLREHPTMADDPGKLAILLGIGESTARRWIDQERERYQRRKD